MRWGRESNDRGMPALPALEKARDFATSVRQGDDSRDRQDWVGAATAYRAAVTELPDAVAIWVQLGHATKEAGDVVAAEAAYRRALELDSASIETHLHLADVLRRQDRRDDAATIYAEILRLDPDSQVARAALVDLGARDRLSIETLRPTRMWAQTSAVAEVFADGMAKARDLIGGGAYPIAAYDLFRRDVPVRPPPGPLIVLDPKMLTIVVDASRAAPFLIRETLRALRNQSIRDWRAIVLAPPAVCQHPVAGFGDVDPRIVFGDPATVNHGDYRGWIVALTAGTALDPEALAWLLFAAARTEAAAVFADHDHGVVEPGRGLIRSSPWLGGVLDLALLPHVAAPAAVMTRADIWSGLSPAVDGSDGVRRAALAAAAASGPVPHVARLLASVLELPIAARGGRDAEEDTPPGRLGPIEYVPPQPMAPARRDTRIAIVIPTRDAADMLSRTIDTLRRTARSPARLDIVIVDNRSVLPETARLLGTLAEQGHARALAFDAPFNWALACNFGARATDAPVLVFANNDIEMLSTGWDDILLDTLDDATVGVVGARLLYPNRTVQHGGMVFGFATGRAEHEGRGRAANDPGPGSRLVAPRAVASVTGAIMAVPRALFDAIDGFDAATLFVGHSDVDFCMRVREVGATIRYCPAIEAIHHESATRGRNETKADVAWDESERADLVDRWGSVLDEDAGVNPYWGLGGVPFDGLREPSMRDVVRHIDLTARARPWVPTRRDAQDRAAWLPAALL